MIRLFPRPIRNRLLDEEGLELALIRRRLDSLQNSRVCNGRDGIRLLGERDLILVFHNPALLDGFLEQGEVLVLELDERDVVRDLVCDGPYGAVVRGACQAWGDLVGGLHLVDVVLLERFGGGDGET